MAKPEPPLAVLGIAEDVSVELRSERRGVATWTVRATGETFRVKAACATSDGAAPDGASVEREARALSTIPGYADRFAPVLVDGALRTTWLDGTPGLASPEDFLACARALAAVHAVGWLHGDVQPGHFLCVDGDVVLLDWGLAHPIAEPLADYRGGLVHANAPELCAQIRAEGSGVATTQTDVYAFGANAFYATTGRFPVVVPAGASYDDAVELIAATKPELSHLAATRHGDVIAACLAPLEARPADMGSVVAMLTR